MPRGSEVPRKQLHPTVGVEYLRRSADSPGGLWGVKRISTETLGAQGEGGACVSPSKPSLVLEGEQTLGARGRVVSTPTLGAW